MWICRWDVAFFGMEIENGPGILARADSQGVRVSAAQEEVRAHGRYSKRRGVSGGCRGGGGLIGT